MCRHSRTRSSLPQVRPRPAPVAAQPALCELRAAMAARARRAAAQARHARPRAAGGGGARERAGDEPLGVHGDSDAAARAPAAQHGGRVDALRDGGHVDRRPRRCADGRARVREVSHAEGAPALAPAPRRALCSPDDNAPSSHHRPAPTTMHLYILSPPPRARTISRTDGPPPARQRLAKPTTYLAEVGLITLMSPGRRGDAARDTTAAGPRGSPTMYSVLR